ncbi:hypothetical protein F5882DRAFT_453266 [Hyaloscypha sp. PMI_1271]|nr:hypothetical protein F5882DRAFT_453266 [Hyaloscypha sp. PMI_1271]
MVKIAAIRESNQRFANSHDEQGLVCVFAGATSGIGASTLERMATMLHSPTFYVIGRSAARFVAQHTKLATLNPNCKIAFLEADVSLLSDVDVLCKQIVQAEKKMDYLYMSPGLMPLNGAQYTKEHLDAGFTLSYYSRMRLVSNLLPLLRTSSRPVILSVLNAGAEKPLLETDFGLAQNWSFTALLNHTVTMTSLAFSYLSQDPSNKDITFLHSAPGLVKTEIFSKLQAPEGSRLLWRVLLPVIKGAAGLMYWMMMAVSVEESGERQALLLVSEEFEPGALRVDQACEVVPVVENGVFEKYVEKGWGEKVWEHTVHVFETTLASN